MVIKVTGMKCIPNNCGVCTEIGCRLPDKVSGAGILKPYMEKRHEKCPLKEVPDDNKKI